MKGLVFAELLEMAETQLGERAIDEVFDGLTLASEGAYTRVGNYPCSELIALVEALSKKMDVSPESFQQRFGHWMFKSFSASHPEFLEKRAGAFDMLEAIEDEVHVEVRKLYPDAELPRFEVDRRASNRLVMRYISQRPLKFFCLGLIEGCLSEFSETAKIHMKSDVVEGTEVVEFVLEQAS